MRRHPGDRHQPAAPVTVCFQDAVVYRIGIDTAGGKVGGVKDAHSQSGPQGEKLNLLRSVVGARSYDRVTGREVDGRDGVHERRGSVGHHRNVSGAGAQQSGERVVAGGDLDLSPVGRLIAADDGLEPEMVDDGVEHTCRHQAGAGIVQMVALPATRRLLPPAFDELVHHAFPSRRYRAGDWRCPSLASACALWPSAASVAARGRKSSRYSPTIATRGRRDSAQDAVMVRLPVNREA